MHVKGIVDKLQDNTYIVDYIAEYGTLEQQEMADDEFAGGLSVVEVFGDNIVEFQRIMKIVADINANAMPMAA